MNDVRSRATQLFADVLDLAEEKRAGFLDEVCRDNPELRREVETLLAARPKARAFFNRKADEARDLMEEPPIRVDELPGVVSHYEIHERIGAGGMGEVYAATDRALNRKVAIKVLPRDFKPEVRDRLMREAWASAKLQYPGIATFYEAGNSDGVDFIAMEFVSGETLREHMQIAPLNPPRAIEITVKILEALVHAHFSGILHRDIKPENIMITPDGTPKILDFGLARGLLLEGEQSPDAAGTVGDLPVDPDQATALITKAVESMLSAPSDPDVLQLTGLVNLTQAGTVMGTFGYMPPEQLLGQPVDVRADVFAVGSVLYEAVSGTPAFPGSTLQEKIQAMLQGNLPPLNRPDLPEELNAVISRALARDPAGRYPSAAAFLSDLRSLGRMERGSWLPVRLAVLDFQDLSAAAENPDWITSALPEALAASLTGISGITQIPNKKVAAVRAANPDAQELDVGLRVGSSAILYGSIKRSGKEVRATAKLSDVATGDIIFEDVVKGTEDEILAMPERFTPAVAELFGAEVPQTARPSIMAEAHKCYVQAYRIGARVGAGRGELQRSLELAERAVELVPDYAIAHAFLAMNHGMSFNFTSDPRALETAVDHAQKAMDADPELADAHLWMGYAQQHQEKHLAAYRSHLQAMRLDPSSFLPPYFAASRLLLAPMDQLMELVEEIGQASRPVDLHRWRRLEGAQLLQRALKLNPKFSWAWLGLGWVQTELGSFTEARWCLNKAVELEPTSVPKVAGCAGYLAESLRLSGDVEKARPTFLEALEELERTDHMYRDTFRGFFLCGLGRAALDQADEEAAKAAFTQAVLHMRGRSAARCGGHVLVQALAGLARSGAGQEHFEEARTLFEEREGFDFGEVWGCTDASDLLELARAARALDLAPDADELLERARDMGSTEAGVEVTS